MALLDGQPLPGEALRFHVAGTEGHWGSNLLGNPGFEAQLAPWRFGGANEVGQGANVTLASGGAPEGDAYVILAGINGTKTGSVYLHQTIPVTPGKDYQYSYKTRNLGAAASEARLILRERDANGTSKDTPIAHAIPAGWTGFSWAWTPSLPGAVSVQVHLRIHVNAGSDHQVAFDETSWNEVPQTIWSAPDGRVLSSNGPGATLVFHSYGTFTVNAEGRRDGARLWTAQATINLEPPVWDTPGVVAPAEANAKKPLEVRLVGGDGFLGPEKVRNGDFSQGLFSWTSSGDREVGGSVEVASEGSFVRLNASSPARGGTLFVHQRVDAVPGETYRLSYAARSPGPAQAVAKVLVREFAGNVARGDTVFSHPLSVAWGTFDWSWTPKSSDATAAMVHLRIEVRAGQNVGAEFTNASWRTTPDVTWSVAPGRVLGQGVSTANIVFTSPGPGIVTAQATRGSQILWTATAELPVSSLPLGWRIVASPNAASTTVSAAAYALGESQLLDGSTSDGMGGPWSVSWAEVEPVAAAVRPSESTEDSWTIDVQETTRAGTVWMRQTVSIPPGAAALDLVTLAQDTGNLTEYAFILRESGKAGTQDSIFTFPSTNGQWRPLGLTWRPRNPDSETVDVILRFTVEKRTNETVTFAAPSLVEHQEYQWILGGKAVGEGPVLRMADVAPGDHSLDLAAVDVLGVRRVASLNVTALEPALVWTPEFPTQLPSGAHIPLDRRLLHDADDGAAVANGDFTRGTAGWRFSVAEVGGNGTWAVQQEGERDYARLDVEASVRGTAFLARPISPICSAESCELALDYRTGSPDVGLRLLLRTRLPNGSAPDSFVDRDTVFTLEPSTRWISVALPIEQNLAASDLHVLHLRALFPANVSSFVDFDNVQVRRVWNLTWGNASQTSPQTSLAVSNQAAGPIPIAVAAKAPGGTAVELEREVLIAPVEVFPRLAGGWGYRYNPSPGVNVSLLSADGSPWADAGPARSQTLEQDGARIASVPSTDESGRPQLEFSTPHGTARLQLDERSVPPTPALGRDQLDVGWSQLAGRVRVHWPTGDATLRSAVLALHQGDVPVASSSVEVDDGVISGTIRIPRGAPSGPHTFKVVVTDVWGEQTAITAADVYELNPAPGWVPFGILVLLGIAMLATVPLIQSARRRSKRSP